MQAIKDFWAAHKAKIISFLVGAFAIFGMVAANVLCGRLPPPFSQICVQGAQQLVDEAKKSQAAQPATPEAAATAVNALDLCPGAPGGDLCLSNGYSLPLPDAGHCRCR